METYKCYEAVALISSCVFIAQAGTVFDALSISSAFENAGIVPKIIKTAPAYQLKVTWETAAAQLGNTICPLRTTLKPQIDFEVTQGQNYTFLYFDPDLPSRAAPVLRSYLLCMYMNLPGTNLLSNFTVAPELAPVPTPGSEAHRIILLVYEQPSYIDTNNEFLIETSTKRTGFNVMQVSSKLGLIGPIFGNFFYTGISNDYDGRCNNTTVYCKEQ